MTFRKLVYLTYVIKYIGIKSFLLLPYHSPLKIVLIPLLLRYKWLMAKIFDLHICEITTTISLVNIHQLIRDRKGKNTVFLLWTLLGSTLFYYTKMSTLIIMFYMIVLVFIIYNQTFIPFDYFHPIPLFIFDSLYFVSYVDWIVKAFIHYSLHKISIEHYAYEALCLFFFCFFFLCLFFKHALVP